MRTTVTSGSASVRIKATPDVVYAVVSDVTRIPEWSPETFRVSWIGGATEPTVGARFRGWNRRKLLVWPTDPVVDEAVQDSRFSFTTRMLGRGRFTRWTYDLAANDDGSTTVTESWEQVGSIPVWTHFWLSDRRVAELDENLATSLARLKSLIEA